MHRKRIFSCFSIFLCLLSFSCLAQERFFENEELSGANLSWQDLSGWRFTNSTLDRADLSNANVVRGNFRPDSTFVGADFSNADLSRSLLASNFEQANFVGAQLANARLPCSSSFEGADFAEASLAGAEICVTALRGAKLDNADISRVNFGTDVDFSMRQQVAMPLEEMASTANYRNRDLQSIVFVGNLTGWDLSNQNLSYSNFQSADVTDVNFFNADIRGATLPDTFTQEQLVSTASFQNKDLMAVKSRLSLAGLDLRGFNLSSVTGDFTNADLTNAELGGRIPWNLSEEQIMSTANYQRKDLRGVTFPSQARDWNLQGINLDGSNVIAPSDPANMAGASIIGTRLNSGPQEAFSQTASYQQKDLRDVVFPSVMYDWDLNGFNLTGAFVGQARMRDVDLRGANLSNVVMPAELQYDNVLTDAGTTYNQWTLFPGWSGSARDRRRFDPDDFGMTYVESADGDVDANGSIDIADLDDLQEAIREEVHLNFGLSWYERDRRFDLNEDRVVDRLDLVQLTALLGTTLGDSNLDGSIDFADFLKLSEKFGSEGTWSEGDFDGNGTIEFPDFLLLSDNFGTEQPPASESVPEPNFNLLSVLAGLIILSRRRKISRLSAEAVDTFGPQ